MGSQYLTSCNTDTTRNSQIIIGPSILSYDLKASINDLGSPAAKFIGDPVEPLGGSHFVIIYCLPPEMATVQHRYTETMT